MRAIDDAELAKLRKLLAEQPVRQTRFRGATSIIEALYDDLEKHKTDKRLTWPQINALLAEWGHPITLRNMYRALAQVRKKRALQAAAARAPRSKRKSDAAPAALSVRRAGTADTQQLELVTHAAAPTVSIAESPKPTREVPKTTTSAPRLTRPHTPEAATVTSKPPAREKSTRFPNNASAAITHKL